MSSTTRLCVRNLSWNTTGESLKAAFEEHGNVTDAIVVIDCSSHRSRGYGIVSFSSPEEADSALNNMHGAEIDGHRVRVYRKK